MTKSINNDEKNHALEKVLTLLDELSEELGVVTGKASNDQMARIAIELGGLQSMLLSSLEGDIGHYWISLFWEMSEQIKKDCSITALRKVKSGNWRVTPYHFNLECQKANLPTIDFVQLSRALLNQSHEISNQYPALHGTFSIRRNTYYQQRFDFSWLKERADG